MRKQVLAAEEPQQKEPVEKHTEAKRTDQGVASPGRQSQGLGSNHLIEASERPKPTDKFEIHHWSFFSCF